MCCRRLSTPHTCIACNVQCIIHMYNTCSIWCSIELYLMTKRNITVYMTVLYVKSVVTTWDYGETEKGQYKDSGFWGDHRSHSERWHSRECSSGYFTDTTFDFRECDAFQKASVVSWCTSARWSSILTLTQAIQNYRKGRKYYNGLCNVADRWS
jgi:hypothetical protein